MLLNKKTLMYPKINFNSIWDISLDIIDLGFADNLLEKYRLNFKLTIRNRIFVLI